MKEILRLENISFGYDEDRTALSEFSVTLREKERVAVVGNNGAGKSTFFLLMNGVLRQSSGRIFLDGKEITKAKKDAILLRRTVGLVFQEPDDQIIAGTVEKEISFGPMNLGIGDDEVRRKVDEAVAMMDLGDYRNRAPHYLSGGEKKRVSIADVLAMEPRMMLFDEPASSLDPANTRLLEENLKKLSEKGMCLVTATHDVDFAWRWATRVIAMSAGRLEGDGTPEEVFSNEALVLKCGLEQPVLLRVSRALGLEKPVKSVAELKKTLS